MFFTQYSLFSRLFAPRARPILLIQNGLKIATQVPFKDFPLSPIHGSPEEPLLSSTLLASLLSATFLKAEWGWKLCININKFFPIAHPFQSCLPAFRNGDASL